MGSLRPLFAPSATADMSILLARLTAARATYLDNIDNANLATIEDISSWTATEIARMDVDISSRAPSGEYDTELDANISTRAPASEYDTEMARITANVATEAKQDNIISRAVHNMIFWSDVQLVGTITNNGGAGGDVTLPNVVVAEIPTGATIFRVVALLKFRTVEETSGGANALLGDQYVQVDDSGASGYTNAIKLVDDQLTIAASATEGGDCISGAIDVAARVDGNDTYSFKIATGKSDADNLVLNEVQIGLLVYFKV